MHLDYMLKDIDPAVASALDRALDEHEITVDEGLALYGASGTDMHLVGMVADELRRRRVGDVVTYVANRNINFTNVCIKQCGFCAFSRDFRQDEGYFLPVDEVVRRAREAYDLGATEVCIQAGLPPDMEPTLYEDICRAIKDQMPDIHIHGFSPEEVLYGASRSQVSVREYLQRLKGAGVDTLPGTSAEILNQELRDRISPGRISVRDWLDIITTAHRLGIRTTSTMMFGHLETTRDRVEHIARIREVQKETGGFTEFVPLNFVHTEAPMYLHQMHPSMRQGAGAGEILLTHAISRIMLNNFVDNIQISWVKEGLRMAQLLLMWGANDLGGTLINESISTSAGSQHGQLLRPGQIKHMARQAERVPAQRRTDYSILHRFDTPIDISGDIHGDIPGDIPGDTCGSGTHEGCDALDVVPGDRFGSYFDLIKLDRFRYKNPRKST